MPSRPKEFCNGSRSSWQSFDPARTARSGLSGRFVSPWMLAISLEKKSRVKKDFDRRILPKSSAPFTDLGVLTACPSEHPRTAPRQLLAKLLVFRLEFADPA